MTLEELARYDGRDGRRAYVAVNGNIFDVTDSPRWANGQHEGAHQAGVDLSADLLKAPHVRSVIERFPVVGRLADPPPPAASPSGVLKWVVLGGVILAVLLFFVLR
jgi:predicted heme/steroid binding protein